MRHFIFLASLFVLSVVTVVAGSLRISDRNPAAIRQVTTNGSQVTLNLQIINSSMPTVRCICPESSLIGQINGNNGNFQVTTSREWVQANHPELLSDPNYLTDRYQNNGELVLLYDADLDIVGDGTMSGVREVQLKNASVMAGNYAYAPEDAFRLDLPVRSEFNDATPAPVSSSDQVLPAEPVQNFEPVVDGSIRDQVNSVDDSSDGIAKPASFKKKKEPLNLNSKTVQIGENNPAVILSGVIKGDVAILNMQFVNAQLPTFRCICPDNAFSGQVNGNGGNFQVYTTKEWVSQNLPEVLQNNDAIKTEFEASSKLPVFIGSVDLQYSGMSELHKIDLGSGQVHKVQYTRSAEDAFALGEIKPFTVIDAQAGTASSNVTQGKKPIHKFDLSDDNPAALRYIENAEEGWKILHLQIVNKSLMLARCICPLTQVHGSINEARGNFTVKVAQAWVDKHLNQISNSDLAQKWQEQRIYIVTGTVLATAVNGGVVEAYLGAGKVQEGSYSYAREDAFQFDGIISDSVEGQTEAGEQVSGDSFFDGLNFGN